MLLTNPQHDAIIKLLVKHHHLTINQLHTQLGQCQVFVSLANLYRIVQSLSDQYILIKKDGALQLHHTRVTELIELAGRIQSQQNSQIATILELSEGEVFAIQASNLLDLEAQWTDLVLQLHLYQPSPAGYLWYNEHAFFTFGVPDIEADTGNKLSTDQTPVWGIVGCDTPMDTRALSHKQTSRKHEKIIVDTIWSKTPGYCLNVYGDRIIEFVMPPDLLVLFRVYFDNISDVSSLDLNNYRKLFEMKMPCRLTIRRDHQQASTITKMIKNILRN